MGTSHPACPSPQFLNHCLTSNQNRARTSRCQRHSTGSDVPSHTPFLSLRRETQQQEQSPALVRNRKRCPSLKPITRACIFSGKQENPTPRCNSMAAGAPKPLLNKHLYFLRSFVSPPASTSGMHFPPPSQSSIPLPQGPFSASSPSAPCPPEPGLEGGCESHISPRNSGKSAPAFNEKIFFFALLSSIAKLIKMESNKKFQQKGGVGEEQREDTTH